MIPQLGEETRKILLGDDFLKSHDSSCTRLAESNRKPGNKSKKEMHLQQSRSIVSEKLLGNGVRLRHVHISMPARYRF